MIDITALCDDTHTTIKIWSEHIPRIGEIIMLPKATKKYKVTKVEHWIEKHYSFDLYYAKRVQLNLKRI